jgi:hypothetical protein
LTVGGRQETGVYKLYMYKGTEGRRETGNSRQEMGSKRWEP